MTKNTTITINGRLYDAKTGQPVTQAAKSAPAPQPAASSRPNRAFSDVGPSRPVGQLPPAPTQRPSFGPDLQPKLPPVPHDTTPHPKPMPIPNPENHPSHDIHLHLQKSQTLNRKALTKPTVQADSTRSPQISKFGTGQLAPAPVANDAPEQREPTESGVAPLHPMVAKVLQRQAAHNQRQNAPKITGKALKEQLIKERLAEVGDKPKEKAGLLARQPRLATILASTLTLLILGGYLTYMNLPAISMRVAASRAGFAATFPSYRPDGYSIDGPITYAPGQVNINYKSNSNTNNFKLTQKASNWDSQAVLDNYVTKTSSTYLTFQQQGITVYTFENKAAWVNGGVFYTVDGEATLSSDQVMRLATSL